MTEPPISPFDVSRRHPLAARLARYATVALLLCLFIGTHYPGHHIPHEIAAADKILHCVAYLGLAFSVLVSLDLAIGQLQPKHYFTVWLVGTLYGAFDEITQIPVGRHCDIHDWFCDMLGIIFALIAFRLTRPALSRLLRLLKIEMAVS
ncbi:MAG: VanZ family protein [Planctomycetota bacterium]